MDLIWTFWTLKMKKEANLIILYAIMIRTSRDAIAESALVIFHKM
jgi:hypothetical protein